MAREAEKVRSAIIAVFSGKSYVFLESGILKCAKFIPLLLAVALAGCGGGSSSSTSNTPKPSGVKTRAVVTNSFISSTTGGLQIVDYSKNQLVPFQMGCCAAWTRLALSSDRSRTYAVQAPPSVPGVGVFDNTTEQELKFLQTTSTVNAFTASADNKFVYAAVRNGASATGVPGAIEFADVTATTLAPQTIPVPLVTNAVLTHNGAKLLAFSDQSDVVNVVDPVAKTATPVTATAAAFDRPVTGFFSADDTKAYVIDCGAECGGTQAGITVVDMTTTPPATISTTPAQAATAAALDGSGNLYVAGTTTSGGVLTVFSVSGASVTPNGAPVAIGDGFHQVISVGNGKVFVGARTCSTGCLSIVDASSRAVTIDTQKGDVTGATPIPNRNFFYVVEGSQARIYDTTTNKESTTQQLDIVGKAEDVLVLDQ